MVFETLVRRFGPMGVATYMLAIIWVALGAAVGTAFLFGGRMQGIIAAIPCVAAGLALTWLVLYAVLGRPVSRVASEILIRMFGVESYWATIIAAVGIGLMSLVYFGSAHRWQDLLGLGTLAFLVLYQVAKIALQKVGDCRVMADREK